MPVKPTCEHLDKNATVASFTVPKLSKYCRLIWLLLMASTSVCYFWLVLRSCGYSQHKTLSKALNCWNNLNVLICGFCHTNDLVVELNGLAEIIRNEESTQLLTAAAKRWIKAFSVIVLTVMYSFFAVHIVTIVAVSQFGIDEIVILIGVGCGQIGYFTIFIQLYVRIILVKKIFKTLHAEIKQELRWSEDESLENTVRKLAKIQMGMVRNFRQSSKILSPGMVYGQLLILGNLILAFYIMVRTWTSPPDDYEFNVQLEVRTYIWILYMIAMYVTQQGLEDVVSRIKFTYDCVR